MKINSKHIIRMKKGKITLFYIKNRKRGFV